MLIKWRKINLKKNIPRRILKIKKIGLMVLHSSGTTLLKRLKKVLATLLSHDDSEFESCQLCGHELLDD